MVLWSLGETLELACGWGRNVLAGWRGIEVHREVLFTASSTEKWADRPQKLNLGLQQASQLLEALMMRRSCSGVMALFRKTDHDQLRCDANVLKSAKDVLI